ncbi:MAG: hypothetical protein ABIQ86_02110 [Steroidobacteraceae bacterium]
MIGGLQGEGGLDLSKLAGNNSSSPGRRRQHPAGAITPDMTV